MRKLNYVSIMCGRCGKEFQAWRKDQKHCEECRRITHRKKQKAWKKRTGYKRKALPKMQEDYYDHEYNPENKRAEHPCSRCDNPTTNWMLCDKCFRYANTTDW